MNKLALGLLTLATVGAFSLPARADDGVVIQDARQEVYQTGDYNDARQNAVQRSTEVRRGDRRGSTGDVQTSDQLSDQFGVGNRSDQRVRQESGRAVDGRRGYCRSGC